MLRRTLRARVPCVCQGVCCTRARVLSRRITTDVRGTLGESLGGPDRPHAHGGLCVAPAPTDSDLGLLLGPPEAGLGTERTSPQCPLISSHFPLQISSSRTRSH